MPFRDRRVRDVAFRKLSAHRPICGICGDPACIDYDLPKSEYLNPHYPVVDHIVPTSAGGSDELSNLQLAGRRCNDRKNRFNAAKGTVKRVPGFSY